MKATKPSAKNLTASLRRLAAKVVPRLPYVFIIVIIGLYGFMLFNIKLLANKEPSDDAIAEKLQEIKQPKVDQQLVSKLQQLKDQNIQVQSLFDQARDNPFQNQ